MDNQPEIQPFLSSLRNKYGSTHSSNNVSRNKSWLSRNKSFLIYGIALSLVILTLIYYSHSNHHNHNPKNIHSNNFASISSDLLSQECPAICGVGYRHSEKIISASSIDGESSKSTSSTSSISAQVSSSSSTKSSSSSSSFTAQYVDDSNTIIVVNRKITPKVSGTYSKDSLLLSINEDENIENNEKDENDENVEATSTSIGSKIVSMISGSMEYLGDTLTFNDDGTIAADDDGYDYYYVEQSLERCEIDMECEYDEIDFVEKDYINQQWIYDEHADLLDNVQLTFAIKQDKINSEIKNLENELLKTSHPSNTETYGKHWSYEKIHSYLAPNYESVMAVTDWIKSYGVLDDEILYLTPNADFVRVTITIQQANDLLNTQFGYWVHQDSGKQHLRVQDDYKVPKHVSEHLDFISPTLRFPVVRHGGVYTRTPDTLGWVTDKNGENEQLIDLSKYVETTNIDNADFILKENGNGVSKADDDTTTIYNTPARLLQLYSMHEQIGQSSKNSQAIGSFLQEWYDDDDLKLFDEYFDIPQADITRIPEFQPDGAGSEAELDIQYITATGRGIHTYVWDVEDDLYFISLLQQVADSVVTPFVVSMSYGGDEQANGESYCSRANIEFAKVGLLGVTFFASSGDNGACGTGGDCGLAGEYLPSFPATSPFVTSIGGTFGGTIPESSINSKLTTNENGEEIEIVSDNDVGSSIDGNLNPNDKLTWEEYETNYLSRSTNEEAWFNSGGGFSAYFETPSWQLEALNDYFSNPQIRGVGESSQSTLESFRFNANGRGYPDLSAQSVNYIICDSKLFWMVSGTSASTPAIAGMFAMINDLRIRKGLNSLGFLNPYLYYLYEKNMKTLSSDEYWELRGDSNSIKSDENNEIEIENDNEIEKIETENDEKASDKTLIGTGKDVDEQLDLDTTSNEEDAVYKISKNYYFSDVIEGANKGCGSSRKAFSTSDGWDPVTGIGTIKFGALVEELVTIQTDDNNQYIVDYLNADTNE